MRFSLKRDHIFEYRRRIIGSIASLWPHLSVRWSVLKREEVILPCSYRSTRYYLFIHTNTVVLTAQRSLRTLTVASMSLNQATVRLCVLSCRVWRSKKCSKVYFINNKSNEVNNYLNEYNNKCKGQNKVLSNRLELRDNCNKRLKSFSIRFYLGGKSVLQKTTRRRQKWLSIRLMIVLWLFFQRKKEQVWTNKHQQV